MTPARWRSPWHSPAPPATTPVPDDPFLILFNAWWEPLDFSVPGSLRGVAWRIEIDTADPAAAGRPVDPSTLVQLPRRSLTLLPTEHRPRTDHGTRSALLRLRTMQGDRVDIASLGVFEGGHVSEAAVSRFHQVISRIRQLRRLLEQRPPGAATQRTSRPASPRVTLVGIRSRRDVPTGAVDGRIRASLDAAGWCLTQRCARRPTTRAFRSGTRSMNGCKRSKRSRFPTAAPTNSCACSPPRLRQVQRRSLPELSDCSPEHTSRTDLLIARC